MGIIEGESRKIAQAICDAFQPFVHERIEEALQPRNFQGNPYEASWSESIFQRRESEGMRKYALQ